MLDQLVESKSHIGEDTRRSSFLLVTFVIMVSTLIFLWGVSHYGKDYSMGGDELSMETLVAPPVIEDQPEPEPEKPEEQKKDPNVDVRKEIIASMSETPPKIPDKPSVVKNLIPPRDPNKYTVKGDVNFSAENAPPPNYTGPVNTSGTGGDTGTGGGAPDAGAPPPPPPAPKKPSKPISGGVLNGKATNLVKPNIPAAARQVGAKGAVNVQIVIDENGNVISASATSGHPLLRPAAVQAARASKFSPTKLSGEPVKVSGVIIYNFQ